MNILTRRGSFYVLDKGVVVRKFKNEKDAKDFIGIEDVVEDVVEEVKVSGVPYSVGLSDIKLPNTYK